MNRTRPFLRAIAFAFATVQLVASGAAPVLEAFASAAADAPYVDGNSLRAPPKHSHDATTCPVCRLIDSPARPEHNGEESYFSRSHEPQALLVPRVVHRLIDPGFLSRAPPAPLC